MGSTRSFEFVTGPETAAIPTAGTPSSDGDVITKGFADTTYAPKSTWGDPVADNTALKALDSSHRFDKQMRLKVDGPSIWEFSAASSASDDGATVLQPTTGSGRWLIVSGAGGGTWGTIGGTLSDQTDLQTALNAKITDPMTTRGDVIIRNSSNATARLAKGAAHTFLKSDGTDVAYAGVDLAADVGTSIAPIANGGTGQATKGPAFNALSPMSASGDLIYGGASGTGTRLPKGSDTNVLTLVSGLPAWAAPVAGFSDPMTTRGDIIVRNSSNTTARLAIGAADSVLGSDGTDVSYVSLLPTLFGSRGTPRSVVAATGITSGASHMSTTALKQVIFAEGSVSGDSVVATITAGTKIGQTMFICGRNDDKTFTIDPDVTTNVEQNGARTFGARVNAVYMWDGTVWTDITGGF